MLAIFLLLPEKLTRPAIVKACCPIRGSGTASKPVDPLFLFDSAPPVLVTDVSLNVLSALIAMALTAFSASFVR
jgi:hypothetical protein